MLVFVQPTMGLKYLSKYNNKQASNRRFRRYNRGLCPKPVFWAPQIADITEDCAKTPPFWPLLRPKRPDSERPEKFFRTVLNHFSVYIQIPFTFSEIELPYLKDPEGFSHAVSLSLSLSNPISFTLLPGRPVRSFPPWYVASKTRKF